MPMIAAPATMASNNMATPTQRNIMINFKGSVSNLVASTKSATASVTQLGAGVVNVGKMFTSVLKGDIRPLVNGVFHAVGKLASLFLTMPGFLLALVNPFNVATMAMANFSAAISASNPAEFVAATRNMAPSMKEAVMAVRLLQPQLKNLYGIVQEGFWVGFADDVEDLARVYFPVLGAGLGGISTQLGRLRAQVVDFLLKPQVVSAINSWMQAFAGLGTPISDLVENLMPTLISMFTAWADILTAMLPLVTLLAGWLGRAVEFVTPLLTGLAGVLSATAGAAGGGSGGGTGGGGGSGGGGGFFGGIISGIGSFFSGLFGGARAEGGPVAAGKSYLIGERGPEILSMGGNGFVSPNAAPKSGHTFVTVKIGETELRGMVSSEISSSNEAIALAARMGRGLIV